MAIVQNEYTGNGVTTLYSFTFPYIDDRDVRASINDILLDRDQYAFANATTLAFNTAPALGATISIFRDTEIDTIPNVFYPGSAIRARDLNDNFTQTLFVIQESDKYATDADNASKEALEKAEEAIVTADQAKVDAAAAVQTANTANTNASAAVSTANTASANASAAVATANTASSAAARAETNSATAIETSEAAKSTAEGAEADAQSAVLDATAAVQTANAADANATAAVSTANTANSKSGQALSTANAAAVTANAADSKADGAIATADQALADAQIASEAAITAEAAALDAAGAAVIARNSAEAASADADAASIASDAAVLAAETATLTANAAQSTADTADANADTALADSAQAIATANSAAAAVSDVVLYDLVPNVASIPASPSAGARVEVADSTGIESFTPLTALPAGFVGDADRLVRLSWDDSSSWVYNSYGINDPDARYVEKSGDSMTGSLTTGTVAPTTDVAGIDLASNGIITVQRTSDASDSAAIQIYNAAVAQPTVEIKPSGSASFAGSITTAGDATVRRLFTGPNSTSSPGLQVYQPFNNNEVVCNILGDGSAQFAGGLAGIASDGSFYTNGATSSDVIFDGRVINGSSKVSITAGGSASLKGDTNIGQGLGSGLGIDLYATGEIRGRVAANASDGVQLLKLNRGTEEQLIIYADGSAQFGNTTDYIKIDPVTNGIFIVESGASKINLNKDGSAQFKGHVQLPGGGGASDAIQRREVEILIANSSGGGGPIEITGTLQDVTDNGSTTTHGATFGGGRINLSADGSITASSSITASGSINTSSSINANGRVSAAGYALAGLPSLP